MPEWIELACRELLEKNIVPSDAHAEAAKLIIHATYESHLKHCKAALLSEAPRSKPDASPSPVKTKEMK